MIFVPAFIFHLSLFLRRGEGWFHFPLDYLQKNVPSSFISLVDGDDHRRIIMHDQSRHVVGAVIHDTVVFFIQTHVVISIPCYFAKFDQDFNELRG